MKQEIQTLILTLNKQETSESKGKNTEHGFKKTHEDKKRQDQRRNRWRMSEGTSATNNRNKAMKQNRNEIIQDGTGIKNNK